MNKNKLKNKISHRFTFMVVPNGAGSPRQFSLHISVIIMAFVGWTAVTFLGTYLSAQHIDYWRAQLSNKILRQKVNYLANQIDKSRQLVDDVKQVEVSLRQMLKLNTDAMNAQKGSKTNPNTGGPTLAEANAVTEYLEGRDPHLEWSELAKKVMDLKVEAESRLISYNDLSGWLARQRDLYRAIPRGWPISGRRTSHFGDRLDPIKKTPQFHFGVDIAGKTGAPIRATADGEVQLAGWHSGYGKLIVLKHEYGYSTRYAHNSKILVKVGDQIKRGQIIALLGNTGKSSGPHCHYEVWKFNHRKNPYTFMIGEMSQVNELSKLPEDELPLTSQNK